MIDENNISQDKGVAEKENNPYKIIANEIKSIRQNKGELNRLVNEINGELLKTEKKPKRKDIANNIISKLCVEKNIVLIPDDEMELDGDSFFSEKVQLLNEISKILMGDNIIEASQTNEDETKEEPDKSSIIESENNSIEDPADGAHEKWASKLRDSGKQWGEKGEGKGAQDFAVKDD